jgi:hypothetical protein
MNPGSQTAEVTVNLAAKVIPDPGGWPPGKWYRGMNRWDWGLYLVGPGDSLSALPPISGESLKGVEAAELVRKTTFQAPAGAVKLRLLVSAWRHVMAGEGISLRVLASYSQDFELNLAAGSSQAIEAKFGN